MDTEAKEGIKEEKSKTLVLEETVDNTSSILNKTMLMADDLENTPESLISQSQQSYVNLGTVIKEKYVLTRVISENTGEAAIFVAEGDGQEYVIKLYHPNKRPKESLVEKLEKITCPHIINILDKGEIQGRYYEVMPYYSKGDLASKGVIDNDFIINTLVPQINSALKAIHEKDIVHRDVKPNNIFLNNDESGVVLGDFGISSILESQQSVRLTNASRTLGYSAPETAQGFVSSESDYYSLGITLLHLVLGTDPFLNMTDQQILKITLTEKLDIPSNIHPRIAQLIKGLTVKERKNRWGYEAIYKWSEGKNVEIKEDQHRILDHKTFVFNGKEFSGLKELAMAFAESWEEGKKRLFRGLIKEELKDFGQDLVSQIMDCEEEENQDLGLFKLIYVLYPEAPLCWRGEIFFDLSKFAEAMKQTMPQINENYQALIIARGISYYLQKQSYEQLLIDEVKRIEFLSRDSSERAYYRLFLLLSDEYVFNYKDQTFKSTEELINYMLVNEGNLNNICNELKKSKYFLAWLEALGYEEQVKGWMQILRTTDNIGKYSFSTKDVRALFTLLAVCGDKEHRLASFVINKVNIIKKSVLQEIEERVYIYSQNAFNILEEMRSLPEKTDNVVLAYDALFKLLLKIQKFENLIYTSDIVNIDKILASEYKTIEALPQEKLASILEQLEMLVKEEMIKKIERQASVSEMKKLGKPIFDKPDEYIKYIGQLREIPSTTSGEVFTNISNGNLLNIFNHDVMEDPYEMKGIRVLMKGVEGALPNRWTPGGSQKTREILIKLNEKNYGGKAYYSFKLQDVLQLINEKNYSKLGKKQDEKPGKKGCLKDLIIIVLFVVIPIVYYFTGNGAFSYNNYTETRLNKIAGEIYDTMTGDYDFYVRRDKYSKLKKKYEKDMEKVINNASIQTGDRTNTLLEIALANGTDHHLFDMLNLTTEIDLDIINNNIQYLNTSRFYSFLRFVGNKIDINARDSEEDTLLHAILKRGAYRGEEWELKRLEREKSDNYNVDYDWPPGTYYHENIVARLIDAGADINAKNSQGYTPLHLAVLANIHSAQIHPGTKAFIFTHDYEKALEEYHALVMEEVPQIHQNLFKILLEAGADPNIQDNDGNTPLMLAQKVRQEGTEIQKNSLKGIEKILK